MPTDPTDPNWGTPDPTDPNWGASAPPVFSRRGGMANPAMQSAADAPAEPDVVTLGELKENPTEAMKRIGAILGKDITDPKMLMTLAASYFGPKLFSAAAPYVWRASMKVAPAAVKAGATVAGGMAGGAVGGYPGAIGGAVAGRSLGQAIAGRMVRPAPPVPEVEAVTPPHLDLSQRVPAGGLTQQQIGERLAAARAQGMTAPPLEPMKNPAHPVRVPLAGVPAEAEAMNARPAPVPQEPPMAAPEPVAAAASVKSPSQTLNEIAIAARRAKVNLTLADYDALTPAVQSGEMSAAEALAQRLESTKQPMSPDAEFAAKYGLPSDAERTFPPNKSGLPTKPPTATKARGKIADLAEMK